LGKRNLLISAHSVQPGSENQILVAVEDITAQKRAERVLIDEQERLKRSLEFGKTALHESEAALLQGRNELRALTAKLMQTQAEERRRVSRELHDDLSQKTAKLQFDIETLEQHLPPDPEGVKKRLLNIRDGVETLSNDIRRIAYELHPSSLDHLGVTVALRSYIREFTEREGIPVRFTSRKVPAKIQRRLQAPSTASFRKLCAMSPSTRQNICECCADWKPESVIPIHSGPWNWI